MQSLSIIVPSRFGDKQEFFLNRMLKAIEEQLFQPQDMEVIICIDQGAPRPSISSSLNVHLVESDARSQSGALNTGLRQAKHAFIGFLEDDDCWHSSFLQYAHAIFTQDASIDMISSNQLEIDEHDVVKRVNDFATPSGWILKRTIVEQVGFFNEDFRWHLDNDYLGRINTLNTKRVHLIEKYAPIEYDVAKQVRPWISNIFDFSNKNVQLCRHGESEPLVRRLVHSQSGMAQIATNPEYQAISNREMQKLVDLYGNVPW